MIDKLQLESIPDDELLRRLSELLQKSRRVEAELVAHIGEVDQRRLYARCASRWRSATSNPIEAEAPEAEFPSPRPFTPSAIEPLQCAE